MGDGAACGDVMEPTSVLVKWLPITNHNSDEAQTSENGASPCTQGRFLPVYPVGWPISPEGFLSLILLLVVIIATVVVTVVVVVIVGMVIVVAVIGVVVVVGGVSFIIKLSFMPTEVYLVQKLGLFAYFAIRAACASSARQHCQITSFMRSAKLLKAHNVIVAETQMDWFTPSRFHTGPRYLQDSLGRCRFDLPDEKIILKEDLEILNG
ncbi:hypothetical protein Tco_0821514 [Tanacetum coccineum]|uniref:Uncharacterized protein n=1 Tax=Tanacetum coccineum TaxID=301880 RepID=A0ABQ5ACI1_9ASTR